MQIRRTTNVQTTNSVNLQTQNNTKSTSGNIAAPVDQLDFSAEAQLISRSGSANHVRMDRVNDLRSQIANGNYDTPERMEAAVSRMLDEMG
jgi:negative regulator of flagellin synthesis FlgM